MTLNPSWVTLADNMKWSTTHILFNYLCYFRSCVSPSAYRRSHCPEFSNRMQAVLTSDLWRTSTPSINCGLGPRDPAPLRYKGPILTPDLWPLTLYLGRYRTVLFLFHGSTAPVGLGLRTIEGPRSYSNTPRSVRLLWTSDQPVAETSTWQHKGKHSFSRGYSNPQSQQANGRSPTP